MSPAQPRRKPRVHTLPAFIPAIPIANRHPFTSTTNATCLLHRHTFSTLRRSSFPSSTPAPSTSSKPHRTTALLSPASADALREGLTTVSEPVIRAAETLTRRQSRATIADLSATAGIPLSDAEREAVKLALLTGAAIDVSDSGDIAYRFPRDVRGALRSRSFAVSLAMTWRRISPALYTGARIAFGVLLLVSIIVTFVSIAALSAAASSSSRDDDRRGSRGGGGLFFSPRFFFGPDIFDVMFYSSYYGGAGRGRQQVRERREGDMSFLEAVYSCVFGDGDPNATFEESRWRLIAALIRANNGAVTGDQLAPYLDAPSPTDRSASSIVDESFVLPALTRFEGRPEVTSDGDIIYVFPSFAPTGSLRDTPPPTGPPLEASQQLSRATPGQKLLVTALGTVNVAGVLVLGSKLASVVAVSRDAVALVAGISAVYPFLLAYAASFALVPAVRWLLLRRANRAIAERNRDRTQNGQALRVPNAEVQRKIKAAQLYVVQPAVFASDSVSYSSDQDSVDQTRAQDDLQDDFDRRLNTKP